MGITSISARLGSQNYLTEIQNGRHTFLGDEPAGNGGQDLGPDPFGFVLAGLALCKAATMRMYAQRKGWEVGDITVHIDLETGPDMPAKFLTKVSFSGHLDEAQQKRMLQIADKCPTHRLLTGEKIFETTIA